MLIAIAIYLIYALFVFKKHNKKMLNIITSIIFIIINIFEVFIIIKVVISVGDMAIPLIKQFQISSTNLFELYGVDILLDETLTPWLMEVNLNPSLNCDSQLDLKVKSHVLTDIFNIIGAIPFSHDGKFTPLEKANNYKTPVEEGVTDSLCEFERPIRKNQKCRNKKS